MEPSQPLQPTQPLAVNVSSTSADIPVGGFDIFSTIAHVIGGSETSSSLLSANGFVSFLNTLWSVYVVLAFAVSILMLVLYAYASTRRWQFYALNDKELRDAEDLYDELYRGTKKSNRLDDVLKHIESQNPNDWKLAIIEADIVLDDLLKQRGYVGSSLGERLKSIPPSQLSSLNDAWEAHKVRNRIAHEGADFVLTQRIAEETVSRYRKVFNEFGL
jgi:preprotein translocase subunit SecG